MGTGKLRSIRDAEQNERLFPGEVTRARIKSRVKQTEPTETPRMTDEVLPALSSYYAKKDKFALTEPDDLLQLTDESAPRLASGYLWTAASQPQVIEQGAADDDFDPNFKSFDQAPAQDINSANGLAIRPNASPYDQITQYQADRRATAKLDYYRKLAELQQMNLEFGRSIRETKDQVQAQAVLPPAGSSNGNQAPNSSNGKANGNHPLTNSFHVATKRHDSPNTNGGNVIAQRSLHLTPPQPHPLPSQSQRTTASLDSKRVAELQRQLDEVKEQRARQQYRTYAEPLSIEDRLSARVVDAAAPRLPVRVRPENQPQGPAQNLARPPQNQAPNAQVPVRRPNPQQNPQAPNGQALTYPRERAAGQPQNQLQSRYQPTAERVREALLDPTRIDPHLIALSDLNPRAAKYYDQVAVSLISISYKRLCKRVLVASALHGEGRTCVTLNLAAALARARQRVLVVDCDLVNPSVLRLLGLDAPIGLSEAVRRGLPPQAAALRVQPASFNLLPTREKVQHSAELLASPRFHAMLQMCEPDYDFILFDSSPLLESADANLLAGLTDATLMVIRPGLSTTQQMARAVSLFNERDICGVVLNRVQK